MKAPALAAVVSWPIVALAQQPAAGPAPTFEVVSITRSDPNARTRCR